MVSRFEREVEVSRHKQKCVYFQMGEIDTVQLATQIGTYLKTTARQVAHEEPCFLRFHTSEALSSREMCHAVN